MSVYNGKAVEITTFINPHLFWVYETENDGKRLALEKDLESAPHEIERNVEFGQAVLVHHKQWKRAIAKTTEPPYSCWLTDYGELHQTNKIYKLPKEYTEQKSFIKQAALNGVVGVKEEFQAIGIVKTEVTDFTLGIAKRANEHLAHATKVYFRCLKEVGCVHIGAVITAMPDGLYYLAEVLIEEGILAKNEELFKAAFEKNSTTFVDLLLNVPHAAPCPSITLKNTLEPLQDVVNSIGLGRGTRVSFQEQTAPGKRQNPKAKMAFLKKWVQQTNTTATDDKLRYDSDDSKSDTKTSNISLQNLSKSQLTTNSDRTGSESGSQGSESPHNSKQKSGASSQALRDDKTTDSCSFTKSSLKMRNETTTSYSSTSVEIEYGSRFDKSGDTGSKGDCTFSPKINSSPVVEGDVPKNYILMSVFKGRGRRIAPNNVEPFGPAKELSSLPGNLPKIDFKTQNASKLMKWEDFPDDKPQAKVRHLNILPSGMATKPRSIDKQGQKRPMKKNESGNTSQESLENSERANSGNSSSLGAFAPNISNKSVGVGDVGATGPPKLCVVGCTCVQCKEWNSDTLFDRKADFVGEVVTKKRKTCVKPPLLFKTENDKDDEEIRKHIYTSPTATNMERATAPKILVHGASFPAPVTSVSDPPFHADIHRALRRFDQVYNIQSFVWPSLMRHTNVCMVGAPKSGKTMAYMPAICSYLLERKERYKDLPEKTISPIAIILCPGTKVAEEVFMVMFKLLDRCMHKPVPALAIQPMDKKCLNQFQKQCDVLVATPGTLVSLLQARLITVKRLCHLVIEHMDRILEKFPRKTDGLLKLVQSMLSHRSCFYTVQLVVTAEQWTLPLENVMKCLNYVPVVCIGSYLEAALYGRVDFQMHFLESQRKMSTLANLLKDKANVCKTVVICNTDNEINEAKEFLHMNGVATTIIYNMMEKNEIVEMELRWLNSIGGKHTALLCTDQVYNHSLHITNAVLLVHYSLPHTWSQFINRFGCMLDNYISPLTSKYPDNWTRCMVHAFVDEACVKQFPKLVELMQRMGAKLIPAFQDFYKNTIACKEQQNIATKIKFCPNLKLFGKCSSVKCRKRHLLSPDLDYSNSLPKSGVVKFKVVHVQDVTSFTVKLLQHTDTQGKTHQWETYDSLQEDLAKAMAKQRICVFDVKPGSWYVLHSADNHSYSRCAVLRILKEEKITKMASEVSIRLLESGAEMDIATSFLYKLPKEFHHIPVLGVYVHLANMVPPDLDESWSSSSKSKVGNILSQSDCYGGTTYGTGQILLQLGNTIWLKNIVFLEDLPTANVTVTKLNLRKTLLDQHLIDFHEEPLPRLYKFCEDAGIELPDYNLPSTVRELNKSQAQAQPQWAFLENTDCNEVYISSVVSPSLFYVRLKKFYGLFENLQKDIQEAIAKPFYPPVFEVQADEYYLAKDPEGDDFCRVKIVEIRDDIVEVCYVDFGDTAWVNKADLKFLSNELIVKLPFQVIECRLYGVDAVWEDWDAAATDILCEYIFEPNTDYFRTLYTTTCKQEPASMTGGQKCCILLVDNFKEKVLLINQLLIDCGQAVTLKDEDLDVQFQVPDKYVEEEEPDVDIDCDKDYTLEDVKNLQKKFGHECQVNNKSPERQGEATLKRSESPASNDSRHSWDIEIHDAEAFMKQLIGIQEAPTMSTSYQDLPPMRALPPAEHCTPNVVWYQTETYLKLNIILPNLSDYKVKVVRGRMLSFGAVYNDKQYHLYMQLFEKVEKTYQHSPSGLHVKVTLTKCTPGEWPRLITSTQRMRHIKYDISQCSFPEDKKKTFLKLGEDLDDNKVEGNIDTFEFGSDEDYSDSDVESCHSTD